MKYLVTPEFSKKAVGLKSIFLPEMNKVFSIITKSTKDELLATRDLKINLLGSNVYVIAEVDLRIYFSFGSDEEGDYILLLDVTVRSKMVSGGSFFCC